MSETSTADPPARSAKARATVLATVLFVACFVLAVLFGTEKTSLARAWLDPSSLDRLILVRARLPRVALAAAAGGGLSVVGAAMQALLRNPIAEPYLLGVSGGAALGATVGILLGLSGLTIVGAALVPVLALAGGFA